MKNDFISIYKNWLKIEGYQFKILIFVSVFENCYGNYASMCEWLRIGSNSINRNKLQEAVSKLEKNGLIQVDRKSKDKFLITLTNKAKEDTRIVEINKQWIEDLKDFNIDIKKNKRVNKSWDTMLKLMVEICYRVEINQRNDCLWKNGIVVKIKDLAEEIGRCESTTGKTLNKLKECNFFDKFSIDKHIEYDVVDMGIGQVLIYCRGTFVISVYDW